MVVVKEMPFEEKYEAALNGVKILGRFAFSTVKEGLGDSKVEELKGLWQKQSEPVPKDASYEEKYEIVFRNWLLNRQTAYDFVESQLGEDGTGKLIHNAVGEWEKTTSGLTLNMFKFVRAISPQTAFRTLSKQMVYQWQAFTPFSLSELTGRRLILSVPHCKFRDVEGCDGPCLVGCQKIYPMWLEGQFRLAMTLEPKADKSCTVTITPLTN
jgi:hypothetical protein